jgi:hypothetical protein
MITKAVTAYPVLMSSDKMFSYLGGCSDKNVRIELLLTDILPNYIPRSCDCDFCTTHKIGYLSDLLGQLNVASAASLKTLKQGSNQASFEVCSSCADVVYVNYKLKGALNVRMLDDQALLPQPQLASPKRLSPQQKVTRWNSLWLSVVVLSWGQWQRRL